MRVKFRLSGKKRTPKENLREVFLHHPMFHSQLARWLLKRKSLHMFQSFHISTRQNNYKDWNQNNNKKVRLPRMSQHLLQRQLTAWTLVLCTVKISLRRINFKLNSDCIGVLSRVTPTLQSTESTSSLTISKKLNFIELTKTVDLKLKAMAKLASTVMAKKSKNN